MFEIKRVGYDPRDLQSVKRRRHALVGDMLVGCSK